MKLFTILLALMLSFALIACSDDDEDKLDSGTPPGDSEVKEDKGTPDPDADEAEFENYVDQLENWIEYMEGIEEEIELLTEEKETAETEFDSAERAREECLSELDDLLDEEATLEGRVPEIKHELEEIGDIESIDNEVHELYILKNQLKEQKLLFEEDRQRLLDEIGEIEGKLDGLLGDWDAG